MSKLIVLQGVQASGKTTYAREYCKSHSKTIRLNRDDIRAMFNCDWSRELENVVKQTEYATMRNALENGYDVILDDVSNLNDTTLQIIRGTVKDLNDKFKLNIEIEYIPFYVTLDECIQRDSLRDHSIGEKAIRDTYRKYNCKLSAMKNREQLEKFQAQDSSLPHCILVDLDNTICWNVTGRPWYGDQAPDLMSKDVPIPPMIDLLNNYSGAVIYLTGREAEEKTKNATLEWIKNNARFRENDLIIMRSDGDYEEGYVVKETLYNTYIKDKYFVDYVLEDSDKIVEMFRRKGLIVLQPYNTSFC